MAPGCAFVLFADVRVTCMHGCHITHIERVDLLWAYGLLSGSIPADIRQPPVALGAPPPGKQRNQLTGGPIPREVGQLAS